MKRKPILFLLAMIAMLAGCSMRDTQTGTDGAVENTYSEEISGGGEIQITEDAEQEAVTWENVEEEAGANTEPNGNGAEVESTYIGILAHVKEISGDQILISSDSDDFPGAFWVEVPEKVYDLSALSGGTLIQILMQDKGEKDTSGVPEYLAQDLWVPDRIEEELVDVEVLLIGAPALKLKTVSAEQETELELYSGNYSWNYMEDLEMWSVVSCGSHPLDDVDREVISLPEDQKADEVFYSVLTAIAPDMLIVRKWDVEDIGNTDAGERSVTTYYYRMPVLKLEPESVYEFTAIWKEENLDLRRFWGEAAYVLTTE